MYNDLISLLFIQNLVDGRLVNWNFILLDNEVKIFEICFWVFGEWWEYWYDFQGRIIYSVDWLWKGWHEGRHNFLSLSFTSGFSYLAIDVYRNLLLWRFSKSMLNALQIWAFPLFLSIFIQFSLTLPFGFILFMNIIFSEYGGEIIRGSRDVDIISTNKWNDCCFYRSEGRWFLAIWRRWVKKEVVELGQLSGNIVESRWDLF